MHGNDVPIVKMSVRYNYHSEIKIQLALPATFQILKIFLGFGTFFAGAQP